MRRVLWAGVVVALGCTTTATLTTATVAPYEATITGGDAADLFVRTEAGLVMRVPRTEIRDIDHPGNVVAVVGGVLAGSGAFGLVGIAPLCGQRNGLGLCAMEGGMAAAGAAMLTWGLWVWLSSRGAVDPPVGAAVPPPPPQAPAPPPVEGPPL